METYTVTISVLVNKLGDENHTEDKRVSIYVRAQNATEAAQRALEIAKKYAA